jgi:hypothetical protein
MINTEKLPKNRRRKARLELTRLRVPRAAAGFVNHPLAF